MACATLSNLWRPAARSLIRPDGRFSWAAGVVRNFNSTTVAFHGDSSKFKGAPTVNIKFIYEKSGETVEVPGKAGQTILQAAHANHIDLEGACEASLACSTCHVVLEDEHFDDLEEASEEEEDMLDLAVGLTSTSRLGCQVYLREEDEGRTFTIPRATRNFYVDGHVPQPH